MAKSLELVICAADDPTEILEILQNRIDPKFLDEVGGDGGGSFSIFYDDPKIRANPSLLDERNFVRCRIEGEFTHSFVIKNKVATTVSAAEKSGEGWAISGDGPRSLFTDARVYPPGPLRPGASETRFFSFASERGSWYNPALWLNPTTVKQVNDITPTNRWRGFPAEWPDVPTAKWIWDRDSSTSAPLGDVYFRAEFTLATATSLAFFMAVDDLYQFYVDGALLAESDPAKSSWKTTTRVDFTLEAGDHVLGIRARNTGDGGPAGFVGALRGFGDPAVPSPATTIFQTGDSGIWKVMGYPASVPGWTPGEVMLKLLGEAEDRGVRFPTLMTPTFTAVLDSNGAPWPKEIEWSFSVGEDYSSVIQTMEELGYDVWVGQGDFSLNMAPRRGYDWTTGSNPVVLRTGRDITSASEESQADIANTLLMQTADGWEERSYSDLTSKNKYGRVEGMISTDVGSVVSSSIADLTFQQKAQPETSATYEVVASSQAQPLLHYHVGDSVQAPNSKKQLASRRIYSISVATDKETGRLIWALEFDGVFQDKVDRLEQQINRLNKGVSGSGGSTGSAPITGNIGGPPPMVDPQRTPRAPATVAGSSVGYWLDDGSARSRATLSWSAVTADTLGTAITMDSYELWARKDTSTSWERRATTTLLTTTVDGFQPGTTWYFRVRGVSAAGILSAYSPEYAVAMVNPIINLPAPSKPTLTSTLGGITARWDGLIGGVTPPAEFDYVQARISDTENGTYTAFGAVLRGVGSVTTTDVPVGAVRWVRFYAYNKLGISSSASIAASILVVGVEVPDLETDVTDAINDAYAHADDALVLAGTKNRTYTQPAAPTADLIAGDLWYDSDDGNKPYRWSGTAWVAIPDATIAAAQATANSKNRVYSQGTAPTGPNTIGDTWFDTSAGNAPKRWDGSTWVLVRDTTIATAQTAANTAQTTANNAATAAAAAQAAADTLFATSQDYVQNPSFETVGLWWIMEGVANYGATTSHTGLRNGLVTGGTGTIKTPMITAAAGTRWRLIYWLYTQAAPTGGIRVTNAADVTIGGLTTSFPNTSSTWIKYVYDFTVPAGNTEFRIRFAASSGSFRVDDVSLLDITAAYAAQATADAAAAAALAAQTAANTAQTTADGKGKVYYQTSAPVPALAQDLWIDITGGNNTPKRWNGTAWATVTDKVATDAAAAALAAQAAATGAQTTADGKNSSYYAASAPTGGTYKINDLWFDTANGNRVNRWNGSAWLPIPDAAIAAAAAAAAASQTSANTAQSTADGKNKSYTQNTPPGPAGLVAGDLWFDTANGNRPNRWSGSSWVLVNDAAIAAAQADATSAAAAALAAQTSANAAQATADGKNKSYTQPAAPGPTGLVAGDLWFDTANGNRPNRWDGTQWVLVNDAAIATAQAAANTAQTSANNAQTAATNAATAAAAAQAAADTIAANSTDLVTNGGFETSAWWALTGTASYRTDLVHAGLRSILITGGSGDVSTPMIATTAGKRYRVTYWLYTQAAPTGGLRVADASDVTIGSLTTAFPNTSSAWAKQTYEFTVPSGVTQFKIRFAASSGSFRLDDVSILDLSEVFNAAAAAAAAQSTADSAVTAANGKNKVVFSSLVASGTSFNGTPFIVGDSWFRRDGTGQIIGIWEYTATNTWTARTIENAVIANLNAGKITAGTLDAARIAANSISVAKLMVTDFTNLIDDPGFEFYPNSTWTLGTGATVITAPNRFAIDSKVLQVVASGSISDSTYNANSRLAVQEGDQFYGEVWIRQLGAASPLTPSGGAINLAASIYGTGGAYAYPTFFTATSAQIGTDWAKYSGTITVPAGATSLSWRVSVRNSMTSGTAQFDDIVIRRMNGGELIVDGAISTNKLLANAVTAAKIAANTITAGQIAAGTITANEIAASTITAAKIAANTITAAQIAVGTITANEIAGGTITAAKMATGTITAASGIIGSIDAGVITVGTLSAARIAAASISSDKLLIGDFTNLADNPTFESGLAGWGVSGTTANAVVTTTNPHSGVNAIEITGTTNVISVNSVPVAPGDQFSASVWYRHTTGLAGTNGGIRIKNQIGADVASTGFTTSIGTWVQSTVSYTVPASGVTSIRFGVATATTGGTTVIDDVAFRRKNGGELIVDGAITTNSLATGAVTAVKIATGTITAASGVIGSIDAGVITVGTLAAARLAANSITGDKLVANTITSREIIIGDFTNFAAGSDFEDATANPWGNMGTGAVIDTTQFHAGTASLKLIATIASTPTLNTRIQVQPNTRLYVSFWARRDAAWNGTNSNSKLRFGVSGVGTLINSINYDAASLPLADTWYLRQGVIVIPSNATYTAVQVTMPKDATAGNLWIDDIVIRRMTEGSLIVDGSITATQIAAGTITSASGVIGALDAGAITTGTLDANRIAANSIAVAKLAIGDFTNLVDDPTLTGVGWSKTLNASLITLTTTSGGPGVAWTFAPIVSGTDGIRLTNTNTFQVLPGDQFYLSARVRNIYPSAALVYRLFWYTQANVFISSSGISFPPADWTTISGTVTAPATAYRAALVIDVPLAGAGSGNAWLLQPIVRRINGGELLVDGAITAVKIATSAITSDKIVAGAITTDKLFANAVTADKIATNTITATQIAANTITAAQIAAGTITATEILGNTITAAKIAANTITAAQIASDTITANEIAANAITATELAANAVTAVKIAAGVITADKMVIGDFTNFVDDPGFETVTLEGWANTGSVATTNAAGTFRSGTRAAIFGVGPRGLVSTNMVPVKQGDQFYLSIWYKHSATPTGTLGGLRLVDQTATDIAAFSTTFVASTAGWTQSTVSGVIPAGVTNVRIKISTNTTAGSTYVDDVEFRRKSGGELIVDGGIVTRNLAAQSITTDKLVISDFSNLIENPGFEQTLLGWTSFSGVTPQSSFVHSGTGAIQITPGGYIKAMNTIEVKPGDQFYLSAWYQHASTPNATPSGLSLTDDIGEPVPGFTSTTPAAVGGWSQTTVSGVIPAGVGNVDLWFNNNSNVTIYLDDFELRRKNGAELIVNGAITTVKLAAGAITAEKLAIGAVIHTGEENQRVPAEMTDVDYWDAVQDGTIPLEASTTYPHQNVTPLTTGMQLVPTTTDVARQQITAKLPVPPSRKIYTKYKSSGTITYVTNVATNPDVEYYELPEWRDGHEPGMSTGYHELYRNQSPNASMEIISPSGLLYTNIIQNGNFLTNITNWSVGATGGATVTRATDWQPLGSAKITPNAAVVETFMQYKIGESLPDGLDDGVWYITGTIRLAAAQTGTIHARARAIYVLYTAANGTQTGVLSAQAPNASGTTKLSMQVTIPTDAQNIQLRFYNGSTTQPVWWDNIMMVRSSQTVKYFDDQTPSSGSITYGPDGQPIYPDFYYYQDADGHTVMRSDTPYQVRYKDYPSTYNADTIKGINGAVAVSSTAWAAQGTRSLRISSHVETGVASNAGAKITQWVQYLSAGNGFHVGAKVRLDGALTGTLGANSRKLLVVWGNVTGTYPNLAFTESGSYTTVGTAPNAAGEYELRGDVIVPSGSTAFYLAMFTANTVDQGDIWVDMTFIGNYGYSGPLFDYNTQGYPGVGSDLILVPWGGTYPTVPQTILRRVRSTFWDASNSGSGLNVDYGRFAGKGRPVSGPQNTFDPTGFGYMVTFPSGVPLGDNSSGLSYSQGSARSGAEDYFPIAQGATATFAMYVYASRATRMRAQATFFSFYATHGGTQYGPEIVVPANTWTQVYITCTVPDTTAGGDPFRQITQAKLTVLTIAGTGGNAWQTGDYLVGDHVTMVAGSILEPYFSGSSGLGFWNGEPNDSTSTKATGGIQLLTWTSGGTEVMSPALFDGTSYALPSNAVSYAAFIMQDPRGGTIVVPQAKVFEVIGAATGESGVEITPNGIRVARDDGTLAAAVDGLGISGYGPAGDRTFYVDPVTGNTSIVGGSFKSSNEVAHTELSPEGLATYDAEGNLTTQFGHNVSTGLAVRDPNSGLMVPLGPQVFGTFVFSNNGATFVNVPGTVGTWGAWREADLAGGVFSTRTGRALIQTYMALSGSALNWTYQLKVRFRGPDGAVEAESSVLQWTQRADTPPQTYMYSIKLTPGRIYTPYWMWRVYYQGDATGTPAIGGRTAIIMPI